VVEEEEQKPPYVGRLLNQLVPSDAQKISKMPTDLTKMHVYMEIELN